MGCFLWSPLLDSDSDGAELAVAEVGKTGKGGFDQRMAGGRHMAPGHFLCWAAALAPTHSMPGATLPPSRDKNIPGHGPVFPEELNCP